MKKYEEYKTTQYEWLGEVPAHWELKRNRLLFTESKDAVGSNSEAYTLLSLTLKGIIPRDLENLKGKFPESFDKYKIVRPNDIVFCLFDVDETPRTVGLSTLDGMLTDAYTIMHVSGVSPKYLFYLYLAIDNQKGLRPLYKGLRKTIPVTSFMSIESPVPALAEQEQIVRYLDWKVAEIDRLVGIRKKQITLTEELIKRLISDAVTRGVNSNIFMQNTGIDWLPEVPGHWRKLSIRAITELSSEKRGAIQAELLSVYRDYGVIIKSSRNDNHNIESEDLSKYKVVHIGDLVLNKMKIWQGSLGVSYYEGIVSPAYIVCRITNTEINHRYLHLLLRSNPFKTYYNRYSYGVRVGQWDMHYSDFKNLPIYLPPLDEQEQIVGYISAHEEKLQKRIKQLKQGIETLQELKARLVSDVVTGNVDVRGITIPDADYLANLNLEDSIEEGYELQEQED